MAPTGENPWERHQPFHLTGETELEPIPRPSKDMLGVPV
jgi:hypothetical protein